MLRADEIWKEIKDYPCYMVSSRGRVKSIKRNKLKASTLQPNGYLSVHLCNNGVPKRFSIHRLVAQTFLPNPNNLPQVNHRNEIKTDNRVENLEWCTAKYNSNYGKRTDKTRKPILQFDKQGNFLRSWKSITEIKNTTGLAVSNICRCCKCEHRTAGGYVWGYVDDYEKIPFRIFNLELYRKKIS